MKIKELGISKEDLKFLGIGACRKVLEAEYIEGAIIYVAETPCGNNYQGFEKGTTRAYYCNKGSISLLFYNLKNHRASQAIKAWNKGDVLKKISSLVWENYTTNGHTTRRGLYADYSKSLDRLETIARSHADYLGNESGDSAADHAARVFLRNK